MIPYQVDGNDKMVMNDGNDERHSWRVTYDAQQASHDDDAWRQHAQLQCLFLISTGTGHSNPAYRALLVSRATDRLFTPPQLALAVLTPGTRFSTLFNPHHPGPFWT